MFVVCNMLTALVVAFSLRFDNCKACNCRFLGGGALEVPKADIFWHVTGRGGSRKFHYCRT